MDDPLQEMLHLLDLMHEAVCVLDANCRIQHANEAMTALLGQSAESIVGVELCVHWIPVAGDDKAPESRALLSRVLEQGETLLRAGSSQSERDRTVAGRPDDDAFTRAENGSADPRRSCNDHAGEPIALRDGV